MVPDLQQQPNPEGELSIFFQESLLLETQNGVDTNLMKSKSSLTLPWIPESIGIWKIVF